MDEAVTAFIDSSPPLLVFVGTLIVLKYPYPREIEENPDYHSSVTTHFLANPPKENRQHVRRCQSDSELLSSSSGEHSACSSVEDSSSAATTWDVPSIHSISVSQHDIIRLSMSVSSFIIQLASKAGYLVKMGAKVKVYTMCSIFGACVLLVPLSILAIV